MRKVRFWNVVWGLLFIAAAGLIILHVLGLTGELNTWSLLLSIPLAAGAIAFAIKMEWLGMFLLLGALTFIHQGYIKPLLGIEDMQFNFWAVMGIAALFGIGFHILIGKSSKYVKLDWDSAGKKKVYDYEATVEHADGDKLHFSESFSGASKYIKSENLSYVSIDNSFGGMEVYFQNAKPAPEGAVVDIRNKFGGVELIIPHDWNIISQINNFAAGADFVEKPFAEGAPTITLRGENRFGGIDVKRV